jgi:hypothetical protein
MCPPGNCAPRAKAGGAWDDIGVERASHGPGHPDAHAGGGWLPAAVIEHEAPGGRHFDLLLAVREPAGPDDRACATWRCRADPSELPAGSRCASERIDAHRAAYLALEGPRTLTGDRGSVRPIAVGRWRPGADGAIEVEWAGARGTERMTLRFAAGETELRRTDR